MGIAKKVSVKVNSIIRETEKAVMVTNNIDEAVWLPKSQINYDSFGNIELPEWLAEKTHLMPDVGSTTSDISVPETNPSNDLPF